MTTTTRIVVFLLTALLTCSIARAAEPKRILLLHSFGLHFEPWSEYAKRIRAELQRQSPLAFDISDQPIATARFSQGDAEAALAEYLRALHKQQPFDLVISLGAPAISFAQRWRLQLFPDVPMVLTAVEDRLVDYKALTENDSVVAV